MLVNQEKEQHIRLEKKQNEPSTSRNLQKEENRDKRPIITQEKPASKVSATNLKVKIKNEKSKKTEESKKEKKVIEKDKKFSKQNVGPVKPKRYESVESKIRKDSKLDAFYLKSFLEKKNRKSEPVKSDMKTPQRFHDMETTKKKEENERKTKSRRDRTRTRTLSPTEIKQLVSSKSVYELASGDLGSELENKEEHRRKEEEMEEKTGEDEDYEDDFEDYDSDFEEDDEQESTSDETPKTAQVKEPEVHNQWKLHIRKEEIEEVKRFIEIENYNLTEKRKSISKPNEDDSDKESSSGTKRTSGLVDFSSPLRRQKITKKSAANKKRGEELLSMISLDAVYYSILEISPIAYDDFMKAFGKSNTKQVHVQTNEDDLDEEVQTDEILLVNKWTQNPAEYLGSRKTGNKISFILTKEERLGVGGDVPQEEEITIQPKTKAMWNFLSWASQIVLIALEKRNGNFFSLENMPNHSKAMPFGDGFASLNVMDIPFLKGKSVTHLCLLSKTIGKLLSVHANKEKSFQKCMICVWSLREFSKPLKVLLASNRVTSCCFGLSHGNLVFAGLSDGSICLWDLREPSVFHNHMTNNLEWRLQSSTYTTAGNLRDREHCSPIVAVRLLNKTETSSGFNDFTPIQICSLDKDGIIIIWTVVQLEKTQKNAPSDDLGLAHWGRVKLLKSSSFSVFASLKDEIPGLYITCNDILINEAEDDGLYVANSLGSVHHCSSYGFPMKPKFYVPSKQDAIVETTCLELCPFNGNYFLVGCGDGTVRLHSRHQENPLICLNPNVTENEKYASVVSLSWMRMRPCVFFVLDSKSRINIWDLGISDMYPEISLVLTEKKITCMRLLSVSDPRQVPFIVIGTEGGSIEIHKLKKEYGCRTARDIQNEMKMFLKYVSIL